MTNLIPWAQPALGEDELDAIGECFRQQRFSQGSKVAAFESAIAEYLNVPFAVAVTNGSVALYLALMALGLEQDDEVIVPAITYIATVNAVLLHSAMPVFADVDRFGNINPNDVRNLISDRTKALIYIDYGGRPAPGVELKSLCEPRGIAILHDAAHSLGGMIGGQPLGSQSNISTLSFHAAKVITTIEGGMILVKDEATNSRLRMLRNQGEFPDRKYFHAELGLNARMTDLQAAIGLVQLRKIESFVKARNVIAEQYARLLSGCPQIMLPNAACAPRYRHPYFFYAIRVPFRDQMAELLREEYGIDTRSAYPMPVYRQGLFQSGKYPFRAGDCNEAERFSAEVLNLPIYPSMISDQVEYVCRSLLLLLSRFNEESAG